MKLYLGIDPGLSGAIALVDGETRCVMLEDMPTAARGHGRVRHEVDAGGVVHLLHGYADRIAHSVIEQVSAMPRQGVASMFSLGHSFGTVTAVIATLGVGFELIAPARWKRVAQLPADKGLVLAAARRRWPGASLTRVKDHGRAEALFMALLALQRHRGC